MATAEAIYRYKVVAGHSLVETMRHFGIKERRVYAAIKEYKQCLSVSSSSVPAASSLAASWAMSSASSTSDDQIAGDNTTWTCPAYGMELVIVPGTKKSEWIAERLALKARRLEAVRWLHERDKPRKVLHNAPALTALENAGASRPASALHTAPAQAICSIPISTAPALHDENSDGYTLTAPAPMQRVIVKRVYVRAGLIHYAANWNYYVLLAVVIAWLLIRWCFP